MADVHPTAIVSSEAELADGVEIGPYTIVEDRVALGAGTVVGPHCHLSGPMTIGQRNRLTSSVVLGGAPQDRDYANEETALVIGDENVFREFVTLHRGTGEGSATRIGHRNMFMVSSHVGHNTVVGNDCVFVNGALVGGHCTIHDRVIMSGNAVLHQFCRVGRLGMLGGVSGSSRDVPPFMIVHGVTQIAGYNRIGMQRAGISSEAITAIRLAYRRLFKEAMPFQTALARIETEVGHVPEIVELLAFIRTSERGICGAAGRHLRDLHRPAEYFHQEP